MTRAAALLLALLLAAPASAATAYTLAVSTRGPVSPSLVTSSPAGISCPPTCSHAFSSGTVVELAATTASTAVFAGWGGARGCGTNLRACRLTMNAAAVVSAAFNPVLDVRLAGNGLGVVTSSGGLVDCGGRNGCARGAAARYSFPAGAQVVLTAAPASSSTFVGWTGSGSCATASTCTFTVSGYTVIVATFSSTGPFTIKVNVRGGGSVSSSPDGIRCGGTCAAEFSSGTVVSLSTRAAPGYYFAGWGNGGCSGLAPCVVVSSSAQQALGGAESPSAYFYPLP